MGWKFGKYLKKGLGYVGKGIKGVTNAIGLTHDTKKDAKQATPEEMEYAKNLINYQAQVDRTQGVANKLNEMGAASSGLAYAAKQDQASARGDQQDALGLARMAATGGAPSAAQGQLTAGLDQAQRQALGLAASGRGNAAANMRNAMQQGAVSAGQANQQAAMLRAGEMAQARDAYAAQAGAIRGADIGREQTYRGLEAGYTGQGAQATLGLNTIDNNVANAANKTATDRFDIEQQNAGQLMGVVKTGLEAYGAIKGSDIRAKENIQPAGGMQQKMLSVLGGGGLFGRPVSQGPMTTATRGPAYGQADMLGSPRAMQAPPTKAPSAKMQAMVSRIGGLKLSDGTKKENKTDSSDEQQKLLSNLEGAYQAGRAEAELRNAPMPGLDALGKRPAARPAYDMSAFEAMQTPTLDALGGRPTEGMLRTVKPAAYNYKPESGWDDGRTHIGVMAQDLEKDPIGRQFVTEREDGAKMVDYQAMAPLLLANQAMLQKKVDSLKKGKG